ncbi:MAG: hypothetical protein HC927_07295 [Deltaproteobacteria bacterium]|nr:hypothetical protein [Deltaproteobacteria bacterium]
MAGRDSPPPYVSLADLQRAIAEEAETDVALLDDPEATLETSAIWAGCWSRVTADDDRRPISFEAAAEPVLWDTSSVDAGTWVIAGYTWEPPQNLWTRAPWVVRVIDGPEQDADPAAALGSIPQTLQGGDSLPLGVCVDADADATLRIDWTTTDDDPPLWRPGESVALGEGSEIEVDFEPPPESWGKQLRLRARVEQGDGRSYEAHTLALLIVFAGGDDDDEGGESEESSEDGDTGGESGDGAESSTSDSDSDERGRGAGRCDASPERGNLLWFVPLVMLSLFRRRSSER